MATPDASGKTVIDDSDDRYVHYEGKLWNRQTDSDIGWNSNFYNKTYWASGGDKDWVEVSWVGTGIKVLACTRRNHCQHTVRVDESPETTTINTFSEADTFNVTIFEVHDLVYGTHVMRITNEPGMTNIAGRTVLGTDWFEIEGTPIEWRTAASSSSSTTTASTLNPAPQNTGGVIAVAESPSPPASTIISSISSTPSSAGSSSAIPTSSISSALVPPALSRPDTNNANLPTFSHFTASDSVGRVIQTGAPVTEPVRAAPGLIGAGFATAGTPLDIFPLMFASLLMLFTALRLFSR